MGAQQGGKAAILHAPPVSVVLFEDRALVTRRGSVRLPAGAHRLVVSDVTPLVSDRTLRAKIAGGTRLDEVRVRRERRAERGASLEPEDLERKSKELTHRLETRAELFDDLEKRRQLTEKALRLVVENINRQLPSATKLDESWERDLEDLYVTLESLDDDWLSRCSEREALELELAEAVAHRSNERKEAPQITASFELELETGRKGTQEIEIEYVVPCALWRPMHRATLRDERELFLECDAALWQATGEDWDDVELRFSTARPTERSEPPVLEDDLLVARRKIDRRISLERREAPVEAPGEATTPEATSLPCVDDGGETRLFESAGRATVRSDGRMHSAHLFSFTAEATVDRLSCPELSPLVHLRSEQTNAAGHPLLAGPLTLLRDGSYVGRSKLDFVGPGERFHIGWGSDDSLRVSRERLEKRERSKLSGKMTVRVVVELFLSNLADGIVSFALQERIPVSELDKVTVKIEADETTPPAQPDGRGIITWPVTLTPSGRKEMRLVYTITATA